MQDTVMLKAFTGTESCQAPSASVAVPILLWPARMTEAPTMGSPLLSTTLPLNVLFWAYDTKPSNRAKRQSVAFVRKFFLIGLSGLVGCLVYHLIDVL